MKPSFSLESDSPDYEQEGDDLLFVLQEELGIDVGPAEDISHWLQDHELVNVADGGEPFYADDQNYVRLYLGASEYAETWTEFAHRIQHERRFFDDHGRQLLASILGSAGSPEAAELPVTEVGAGTEVSSIYRARRVSTEDEALIFLKNASRELGPPPSTKAVAGRMNAAGISVFYGALSPETAVAEVRPSVGSVVMVGRFEPVKILKLLDLRRVGVGFAGSIFDPDYAKRATRLRFLQRFHHLIARPVQAGDAPLAYIPTQAVAEYVSNVLQLDGLLYGSAQLGAVPEDGSEDDDFSYNPSSESLANHNVVLFASAGQVYMEQTPSSSDSRPGEELGKLRYVEDSAEARRITRISYEQSREFIFDPDEDAPF